MFIVILVVMCFLSPTILEIKRISDSVSSLEDVKFMLIRVRPKTFQNCTPKTVETGSTNPKNVYCV